MDESKVNSVLIAVHLEARDRFVHLWAVTACADASALVRLRVRMFTTNKNRLKEYNGETT